MITNKKTTWTSHIKELISLAKEGDEEAEKALLSIGTKLDTWNEENPIPNGFLNPPQSNTIDSKESLQCELGSIIKTSEEISFRLLATKKHRDFDWLVNKLTEFSNK